MEIATTTKEDLQTKLQEMKRLIDKQKLLQEKLQSDKAVFSLTKVEEPPRDEGSPSRHKSL
jgi:hypothetical protein